MLVDLHNHTPLCNHAEGEIDEYIKAAIQKKVRYFGFSDHAPMDFDPSYRMSFDEMTQYEKAVNDAKIKYKDEIEILLGYEVDYLKNHMDERVLNADVDYLIGSVHFIDEWGFDNPEFIGRYENQDIDLIWQQYFDAIEEMANSKKFDIAGNKVFFKKDIKQQQFFEYNKFNDTLPSVIDSIKETNYIFLTYYQGEIKTMTGCTRSRWGNIGVGDAYILLINKENRTICYFAKLIMTPYRDFSSLIGYTLRKLKKEIKKNNIKS